MSRSPARRRGAAIVGSIIAAALLSACSSKPESRDIAAQLAGISQECDLIAISDVKKLDGAEGQNGLYEVAYSFRMEINGGKLAAADLLAKWQSLKDQEQQLIRMRVNDYDADRAREQRLLGVNEKVVKLLGSCQNLEALSWLEGFRTMAAEASKGGQAQIPVPFARQLVGAGMMQKAESGWVFTQMMPHQPRGDVILSEPIKFDRRPPGAVTSTLTTVPSP